MMKKLLFQFVFLLLSGVFLSACHQKPMIAFQPFQESKELTYEDLLEAGFYHLNAQEPLVARFDGMKQVSFNLRPSDCVPNIMTNGMNCAGYELADRTFSQYFDDFDSLSIEQTIEYYGGKTQGTWRKDILEGEYAGEWEREWFFPIYVGKKRFLGTVMVRKSGFTALAITATQEFETSKRSPSVAYILRDAARQLLTE